LVPSPTLADADTSIVPRPAILSPRHPAALTLLLTLALTLPLPGQQPASPLGAPIPHRYLIVYRDAAVPSDAELRAGPTVRFVAYHQTLGIAVLQADPASDDAVTIAALRAQPNVVFVVHDRLIAAHRLILRPILPAVVGVVVTPPTANAPYDTYYTSTPQAWAVLQSGGFGANVPGGPVHGPWDTTMGAGVRIAILDSGVDQYHPDIAPNLALNLSEIDQSVSTGLPSPCDDGTPQDQQGHGTWTRRSPRVR
jgi:hypothetical protein